MYSSMRLTTVDIKGQEMAAMAKETKGTRDWCQRRFLNGNGETRHSKRAEGGTGQSSRWSNELQHRWEASRLMLHAVEDGGGWGPRHLGEPDAER